MYEEALGLVFRFVLSTNGFDVGMFDFEGGDGEEDGSMSWISIEGGWLNRDGFGKLIALQRPS